MGFLPLLGAKAARVKMLPLEMIDPNPAQPRRTFEKNALEELAVSIKENGLLSPVSVRKVGDRFQLIAGERRLMAFHLLGEEAIPALVEEADDRRSAALALVENMQRRDLTFFEEAQAMEMLIKTQGLTQQQAAQRLGLSQSAIANKLRLLKLPRALITQLVVAGLTERHARALLPLCEDSRLDAVVTKIIKEHPTVVQTEKLVEGLLRQKVTKRGGRILVLKDLRLFTSTIGQAIEVMKQAGISAKTDKTEDEEKIVYTITISKTANNKNKTERNQTPPLRTVL